MDDNTRTELEAAAFRRLVEHFRENTDVQNIDLMNLAGFCRNCLWKWYSSEARKLDPEFDRAEAQQYVYGMTIDQWKRDYQTEASAEQQKQFEDGKSQHAKIEGY